MRFRVSLTLKLKVDFRINLVLPFGLELRVGLGVCANKVPAFVMALWYVCVFVVCGNYVV